MLPLERPLAPGAVLVLPGGLEPGDGRRRQARHLRPEQRLEGLGEVAGADALEVQPGDQPLQALGLPQVGRQDRRGERLPLVGRAAVPNSGLLDLERPDAGLDGSLGEMAVADHLLPPGLVLEVGVVVDPGGDLGLDGPGEHRAGPVAKDRGEDVLAVGRGTMRMSVVDSFMAGYSSASWAIWCARNGCITKDTPPPSNSRTRLLVIPHGLSVSWPTDVPLSGFDSEPRKGSRNLSSVAVDDPPRGGGASTPTLTTPHRTAQRRMRDPAGAAPGVSEPSSTQPGCKRYPCAPLCGGATGLLEQGLEVRLRGLQSFMVRHCHPTAAVAPQIR